MNIGIIGRQAGIMSKAMTLAAQCGHAARGTLHDAEAIEWISARTVDALVIGGGVEAKSRAALLAACAAHGVKPVEVFGPENLERALRELGA